MFLVVSSWLVIIILGMISGLVFNKMIIDQKLLKVFNISLVIILVTITLYFVMTMKNLL